MPASAVTWTTALDRDGGEPVAAWVFSLAEAGTFATLEPTEGDRRDLASRRGADASRFLARRSVLRQLVARRSAVPAVAVEIGYDRDGAPLILAPSGRLFCSVAARGDHAAVALAETPVGIDLEHLEPGPIPWAVLAREERGWLQAQAPAAQSAAFLHLWTVKEAYLKARRSGLMTDPSTVAVSVQLPAIRDGLRWHPLPSSTWFRSMLDGRPVVAACVVPDPD